MKNNCCWVNYKWVQNQAVILEMKSVVLGLTNYATKEKLENAAGVDIAAKKDFIVLKTETLLNWVMFQPH